MKKSINLRYMAFGVMLTLLISNLVVPAAAAFVQKTISVSTGVSIYMDDNKLSPTDVNGKAVDVFVYNGTTYLPVRAVSEALGKPVQWDGSTQSVYIGNHSSSSPVAMLYNLDYFNASSGTTFQKYTTAKDNLGNTYSKAIGGGASGSESWQEYIINGAYSSIKGRVILNYDYRTEGSDNTVVTIYCDDKLVYTSPKITAGVQPTDFSVDLNGVLKLKVVIDGVNFIRLVNCGLYT